MADVSITALPAATRIVLRGAAPAARAVSAAFGVDLPSDMLTSAASGARAALRLGPDEWLLLAEHEAAATLPAALAAALGSIAASVVEVSDRQVAFHVAGAGAADLLNEGCPLDLSDNAFPPGACTRTLFGKAEIVLWRPGSAPGFRIEVARSYAAYVEALLR